MTVPGSIPPIDACSYMLHLTTLHLNTGREKQLPVKN